MNNLIIYGGAFDPLHNGHLKTALAVQQHFQFDRFLFLPAKASVLKNTPIASAKHRYDMLDLTLKTLEEPKFSIDVRELYRKTPSYMVTTLQDFRNEYGKALSITLLIGQDAYNALPSWFAWQSLPKLANILVISRPNIPKESFTLNMKTTLHTTTLKNAPSGYLMRFHAGSFEIASSNIREALKEKKDVSRYLPLPVLNYIHTHHLYGV